MCLTVRTIIGEYKANVKAERKDIMEIKHSNWFAAGPEIQRALMSLSDGAFRLYFYLCLNASRRTGRISMSYCDLAATLERSRRSISSHFDELRHRGICIIHPAVNQHDCTEIEIADEFWPYTKANTGNQPSNVGQNLGQIKTFLSARLCVQCTFTAADQKFATELLARDIALDQIERAIALGCCRRYISLLNGTASDPIFSLLYFRDVIEEVCDREIPIAYWSYIMPTLEHLEEKWQAKQLLLADAEVASAGGRKAKRRDDAFCVAR
jgi:hypothetical protein